MVRFPKTPPIDPYTGARMTAEGAQRQADNYRGFAAHFAARNDQPRVDALADPIAVWDAYAEYLRSPHA